MPGPTVTIEKLVAGGKGLARTAEGVVLVEGVAPGETVLVSLTGKKGGVAIGRPAEIITPSPRRRTPPCPLAGSCGGCDWLHLSYASQPALKEAILRDCLLRIGRISELPGVIELFPSPEFGYRHRAQFKIDATGRIGFFARNTNEVVPLARCPLLADPLNDLLAALAAAPPERCPAAGTLRVMAGSDGVVASQPLIPGLTVERVTVAVGGSRFGVSGGDFFQSNGPLLDALGRWALPHVKGDLLLNLYGGSGFFSVMLAPRFRRGILVESDGSLAAAARTHFEWNGADHCSALACRAEDIAGLPALREAGELSCIVVDPPRSGMSRKVREAIAGLRPTAILAISCDPSTQARDTGFLVNRAGYRIDRGALFDLYPDTHHIESALLLVRQDGR